MIVNLNSTIRVKLTPLGADLYYAHYRHSFRYLPKEEIERLIDPIRLTDNIWETQLWFFASVMGPHLYMGGPALIEGTDMEVVNL